MVQLELPQQLRIRRPTIRPFQETPIMRSTCSLLIYSLLMVASLTPAVANAENDDVAQKRSFTFHYDFRVHSLAPGTRLKVWLPIAQSDEWQSVVPDISKLPGTPKVATESKYGNRILFFETPVPANGELQCQIPYRIVRKEVRLIDLNKKGSPPDLQRFLSANNKVPLNGKIQGLMENKPLPRDPLQKAQSLYNLVDDHVRYAKVGQGWGQGDVEWVCDSRYGNCTDFHSLFIAMARSQQIPARFEIGFPIPDNEPSGKVGGYHCWGWFHVDGKGWVPVDISEADKQPQLKDYYFGNLAADRVAFSTGRDLALEPKQSGPPLNFFVYPYLEDAGKPLSREHIELQFHYSDGKATAPGGAVEGTK